ncbi:MerR family transcriptional regulator [Candidatus Njordibacter sp. Uisw_056]|jgi:DNA-binding transcriptional MerR regulator|uniref:MerR family transcriptional regulator n=1 Tax=Candidatus Njordibacter sp. Uisw_056 TaxID=3230973 RepID=UPI003D57FCE4|tara:strand:+ start:1129 stop:2031 length:903 start_codon:yes stop_codon:yes gene_type:complete
MTIAAEKNVRPQSQFPIRELSARTKINTVTLRAWERRYGLLKPQRTPKGHRLYSEKDVDTIERILTLVARGVPIGKVKVLLEQNIVEDTQVSQTGDWQHAVAELLLAVETFSVSKVEHLIHKSFANYPAPICSERLLKPLFSELILIDDHGAALGFADSELVRYASLRSSAKVSKKNSAATVVLIAGHQTPIWRLALMALELTDAKFSVHLLTHSFTVAAAIELAGKFESAYTVFYQDGIWKDLEKDLMANVLLKNDRLFLCGTAPVLANLYAEDRVFKNSNSCIDGLIKRQTMPYKALR